MTDQSPNDIFKASSFLHGHNAEYIEPLYARYASDPNAVDESWQSFFKELGDAGADAADDKIEAMRIAGIIVTESPDGLGEALLEAIG